MNSSPGSITKAIAAVGEHDQSAAELIWQRFFDRLCGYARSKIYDRHRRLIAPDEIAANAFLALFTGLKEKRFEKVRNRDELWQMLTLIAARDAINEQEKLQAQKRGGGKVSGSSAFGSQGIGNVRDYVQRDPPPEVFVELEELSQRLLRNLPSDELRNVAIWRMAGYSNAEIAEKLGRTERTVERRLNLIREIWSKIEKE